MHRDVARPLDNSRDYRDYWRMAQTTGIELRLERVAARVKLYQLAKVMNLHRATVARYEGLAIVDEDVAYSYREALATLREVAA